MDTQKQVVHFQAKKGFTTAQSNEHQRRWTEKGWESANENGRIDRTRVGLNFEVVKGGKVQAVDQSKSIPQKYKENLAARGIADPNEKCGDNPRFRSVVDFIISGSHDTLCSLAFGNQEVDYSPDADNSNLKRCPEIERWAKDMYGVLAGRFGEENILSFVIHLDERTPHVHADIVPVTADGKINYKEVFAGADKYEYRRRTLALHDAFAEVNRRWGLQRGDSVAVTHAKKKSHEEYRRELSEQCSALEREVEHKTSRLSGLDRQIQRAEIRKKALKTMVSNLESARGRIEKEIDAIRRSLADDGIGTSERQELLLKEETLQKKLEEILAKLSDKQEKLSTAAWQLSELQERLAQSEGQNEELQRQIASARADVSQITMDKVSSEALWVITNEFKGMLLSVAPERAAELEDSLLMDMSRKGMRIVTCAALLSMGLVDQATTFAENCGGGGGSSRGGWGRDPDEDEQQWLRRCLARSRQMMKPSGQKLKR